MDYSIHDAIEAGFNHVVFIIRKDIEKEFKEVIGDRIASIGTLVYNNQTYYLCAKQGNSSDRLLQGKCVFMTHQDELVKANPDEVFLMSSYVGFVVDPVEECVQ